MATKAERELAALREAQTDADPTNDPTTDEVREAEQRVADQGRRPEDIVVDRRDEFHALRVQQAKPNPDGEWLLPVDDRGRNLMDPAYASHLGPGDPGDPTVVQTDAPA